MSMVAGCVSGGQGEWLPGQVDVMYGTFRRTAVTPEESWRSSVPQVSESAQGPSPTGGFASW